MGPYEIFLLVGVLYTGVGSDLLLNWGAGLITGKRLKPQSKNFLEPIFYRAHARIDPNMRAIDPVIGPADRIPAWNHALAVFNGTLILALEIIIVIGLLQLKPGQVPPDYVRLAGFAWLMRGVFGELLYWHVLTQNEVAPLRGKALAKYWLIGMPQAFFPFLVAERFYVSQGPYHFEILRLLIFLGVPLFLMAFLRLSYRGRVY